LFTASISESLKTRAAGIVSSFRRFASGNDDKLSRMECRVCKCTDENACAGGCVLFCPDLCSLCALAACALAEWRQRAVAPDVAALITVAAEMVQDAVINDESPLIITP